MPIDYEGNRDLAKQIAANQFIASSSKYSDAIRITDRLLNPGGHIFTSPIPNQTSDRRLTIEVLKDLMEGYKELMSEVENQNKRIYYQEKVIGQLASPDYRKGWSRWETLGDRKFSAISAISNADGRLEVFGVGTDQLLWNCWTEDNNSSWHDWNHLGDGLPLVNATAARNADGRLEVFALGKDGSIHNRWQKWAGGPISGWNHLGGQFKSSVSVGYGVDGRMELFALGSNRDVQHRWQVAPSQGLSNWYSHGGEFVSGVSVARNQSNSLEIFGVGTDRKVYHKWQHEPNSRWSDWNCLGGELNRVNVGRHPNGRLEIFGERKDHIIDHKWQDGNGWSDWHRFGDFKSAGVDVMSNREGLSVYSYSLNGFNIWRRMFNHNNGWSGWSLLSTEQCKWFEALQIKNGKEALFIVNGSNQIQYSRQV